MNDSHQIAAVGDALRAARRHLGDALNAAYLFGSALDGGLRVFSDLDLLFVVAQPLSSDQRKALVAEWLRLSGLPGSARRPLEVTVLVLPTVCPWRYPAQRELQFGEWLRDSFDSGNIPPPQHDPDLAILLSQVRQCSSALLGPPAKDMFDPVPIADLRRAIAESLPEWLGGWQGDERNAVLALSRMWLTASTGGIRPKDAAADWILQRLAEPHRRIVACARDEYLGRDRCDWVSLRDEVHLTMKFLAERVRECVAQNQ